MGVANEANGILHDIGRHAKGFWDATKGAFTKDAWKLPPVKEAGFFGKMMGGIGSFIGGGMKAGATVGMKIIELPFTLVGKAGRAGVNGVGGFMTKHPKTSIVLGATGAALGIGTLAANHATRKTNESYAQMASMAEAGPVATQRNYNGIEQSPEYAEYLQRQAAGSKAGQFAVSTKTQSPVSAQEI